MWKVYHIQTGKIIRAGFNDEDDAKSWLERRRDISDADHETEEMDEEEELEYEESDHEEDDVDSVSAEHMPEPLYHADDDDERGVGNNEGDAGSSEFEDDNSGYNLVDDEDL